LALFGHGGMSDLSPLCAPEQTLICRGRLTSIVVRGLPAPRHREGHTCVQTLRPPKGARRWSLALWRARHSDVRAP